MTSVIIFDNFMIPFSNIIDYWVHEEHNHVSIDYQHPFGYNGTYSELKIGRKDIKFDTKVQCWELVNKLNQACIKPTIIELDNVVKEIKYPIPKKKKKKEKEKEIIIGDGGDPIS